MPLPAKCTDAARGVASVDFKRRMLEPRHGSQCPFARIVKVRINNSAPRGNALDLALPIARQEGFRRAERRFEQGIRKNSPEAKP